MFLYIAKQIKPNNLHMMPIRHISSLDYTYYLKKMFPIPDKEQKQENKIYLKDQKKNRQEVVFLDYTYYMYEQTTDTTKQKVDI
jgi:hypothetical protein